MLVRITSVIVCFIMTCVMLTYLPACAEALRKAQAELKRRRPDLSLCIFDATRPMSVQQTMWDAVKDTPKYFYVSNPAHGGGMHNYGMAAR